MATNSSSFAPERVFLWFLLLPIHFLYGCFLLTRLVVRGLFRAHAARQALASEIRCPNGHPNPTHGRFECAACRATYHGWVGRCGVCGAGCAWFPCDTCGVAIPLPWERP